MQPHLDQSFFILSPIDGKKWVASKLLLSKIIIMENTMGKHLIDFRGHIHFCGESIDCNISYKFTPKYENVMLITVK